MGLVGIVAGMNDQVVECPTDLSCSLPWETWKTMSRSLLRAGGDHVKEPNSQRLWARSFAHKETTRPFPIIKPKITQISIAEAECLHHKYNRKIPQLYST